MQIPETSNPSTSGSSWGMTAICASWAARIAADLGYADMSAFYRACIEWTGLSPAHYRRQWAGTQRTPLPDRSGSPR